MPINRIRLDDVDVRNLSATTSVLNTAIGEVRQTLDNVIENNNKRFQSIETSITQVQSDVALKANTVTPNFTGLVNAGGGIVIGDVLENIIVTGTSLTGTINIDCMNNTVYFYTLNSSGNWTFNFRGDAITSLNSYMLSGQMMTIVILATNGATPFRATGFQIDGNNVTVRWADGLAPATGNANSVDIYTFTIIKTANNLFSTFGSLARFA